VTLPLEELERCIHCGYCLPACPTYAVSALESHSPRGRLALARAWASGEVALDDDLVEAFESCLGCRACETACPVGVRYGKVFTAVQEELRAKTTAGPVERLVAVFLAHVVPRPRLLRLLFAAFRAAAGLPRRMLRRLLGARVDLLLALRAPLQAVAGPVTEAGPPVYLFKGCVQEAVLGDGNRAAAFLLAEAGYRVVEPAGQTCCGALHLHRGDPATARRLARRNLAAFERAGEGPVVVAGGGCAAMLRELPELFPPGPERERAERFASRVRHTTQLLTGRLPGAPPAPTVRVTFQDSCHLRHAMGVSDEPRRLLGELPGVEFVEMDRPETCCGAAGVYGVIHPEMSQAVLDRKLDDILATGAEVVLTANPGCLLQLRAGIARRQLEGRLRAEALETFLAERLVRRPGQVEEGA
jgi:glycolate oxidase iron-sulfur subunit